MKKTFPLHYSMTYAKQDWISGQKMLLLLLFYFSSLVVVLIPFPNTSVFFCKQHKMGQRIY